MRTREQRLVDVARRASRFFRTPGYLRGPQEDILLGRELQDVLAACDDVEPIHDADRVEWQQRQEFESALVNVRRA